MTFNVVAAFYFIEGYPAMSFYYQEDSVTCSNKPGLVFPG